MSSQAIPGSNHDEWHRVHAQLLKSVADAQAKLLAAQNETNDRLVDTNREIISLNGKLESQAKEILGVNETLHRIRDRLDATQETVRILHGNISGRLDGLKDICVVNGSMLHQIGTELPRRQVERLKPKRIVKRAVERKR